METVLLFNHRKGTGHPGSAGSALKNESIILVNGAATFFVRLDQIVEKYFQTESGNFTARTHFTPKRAYGNDIYALTNKLETGKNDLDLDITGVLGRMEG